MKRILISVLIIFSVITAFTRENNQAVPYTLDDKDRMIKVETKLGALEDRVENLEVSLNNRIDHLDKNLNSRIDRLEDKFDTYFTWGFGMVLGTIFALFGFILYDRWTTLAPVKREQYKVIETLRELGK